MNIKPCHICKQQVPTQKTQIQIKLLNQTLIPLTMTSEVCKKCEKTLKKGIKRRTSTLYI